VERTPITLIGLARQTCLPREWLLQEALAGRLPCLRIGRMLLFDLAAVQAALCERAAKSREVPNATS
jgi:hypothetical protein